MFSENRKNGVIYMTSGKIKTVHAFTTRFGGVSSGVFESLNLAENRGDNEENVRENYRRLRNALGISGGMVFSKQVHGTVIRTAAETDRREPFDPLEYEADGLITDKKGLPLIIFAADCLPILMHDPVKSVICAVHAGWRGTTADIAGKAVRKMCTEFSCSAENIRAAIGPGIGKCCFETGAEVADAVKNALGDMAEEFLQEKEDGKFMTDLRGVNRELLVRAGISEENIDVSDECTRCSYEKYWSHRYTKGERGGHAAVIMM